MHIIQEKLLRLVETYNLGSMSFRDIGKIIGDTHPQLIKHHLEQLKKHELIVWDKNKKIIKKIKSGVASNADFVIVPVVGLANCGEATAFADEHIEGHIKISTKLLSHRREIFAIQAVGSSMNKANIDGKSIENGDYVIVDSKDKNIKNNDYVLSIIDDVANIKKVLIDKANKQIILFSESTNLYPAIYIDISETSKYLVNGKIIQVIKNPKF